MASARFTVGLHEVHYHEPDDEACVDIIAIHGLDTKSPDTWLWKPETKSEQAVNWLGDPKMLPSVVKQARVFTCDWPAEMFVPRDRHEGGLWEASRFLLASIRSRSSPKFHGNPTKERPIVFIASCLGGIILMQALTMATEEYLPILRSTRAIVFLATPFRGTSFESIAEWAERGLRVWASLQTTGVTTLLEFVKRNVHLNELVRGFTQLSKEQKYRVQTFYKLRDTSLSAKIPGVNVLPKWMLGESLQKGHLVNEESASLDIVPHPLPLDRPHITMNKFGSPDDADYQRLSESIRLILSDVRQASPLTTADKIIRNHYTADMLRIERLSGDVLPMQQCYINLALIERQFPVKQETIDQQADKKKKDNAKGPSLSLFSQLRTETPAKEIEVDLEKVFDARKGLNGSFQPPRRILIRGRAGVGKSTLCKKIVYNFTHLGAWVHLFDRLIWIPLRNLKSKEIMNYNLQGLLFAEFFSQSPDGRGHAENLWRALEAMRYGRTLFILDGLDEISEAFGQSQKLQRLLHTLLDLPNVIITTRPHVDVSNNIGSPLDLELETVGFTSEQVNKYLKAVLDEDVAKGVQSFIDGRPILQGLVKIPIQLDAVCYVQGEYDALHTSQTMTALYRSLENSLWKKDIKRLDQPIQEAQRRMIEAIAFSGLLGSTMNFEYVFREEISQLKFPDSFSAYPTWEDDLAKVSFMRASGSPASHRNRTYHFLHLTFQEYFAARYYVRHWEANAAIPYLDVKTWKSNSIEPTRLIQTQKYTARFDIFWRFVCGLLDSDDQVAAFFEGIKAAPRDIVGFRHVTLMVRCLNELPESASIRESLEHEIVLVMESTTYTRNLHYWPYKDPEFPDSLRLAFFFMHSRRSGTYKLESSTVSQLTGNLADPYRMLPFLSSEQLSTLEYQDIDSLRNDLKFMHQQPLVLERIVRGAANGLENFIQEFFSKGDILSDKCEEPSLRTFLHWLVYP